MKHSTKQLLRILPWVIASGIASIFGAIMILGIIYYIFLRA